MVEDKDADPTPDKARGGSEQSMPGEASVSQENEMSQILCWLFITQGDQIANSEGAYDGSTTRPESSGKEIESEVRIRYCTELMISADWDNSLGQKDANMSKSAAYSEPSKNATDGESKQTTSQGEGGSKPKASSGSAVRGGNAK